MGGTHIFKTEAFTDVNAHILEVAVECPSGLPEWEFFCECGRPDCHLRVMLTVDQYGAIRDVGGAVLAGGHKLSQPARARLLCQDAAALGAQARVQAARAKKNLA